MRFVNFLFVLFLLTAFSEAASVDPFVFEEGMDSSARQAEWDYLMKYKIFGQKGIVFKGQNIKIPDKSGWFGTATGNFDVGGGNMNHLVGGPILIGGDMIWNDGHDTLSTGPVRVLGNVEVGNFNGPNVLLGDHCVKGTVAEKYKNNVGAGNQYFGDRYSECPLEVPQVKEDLVIPSYVDTFTYAPALKVDNNTAYIDVPSGTGAYDYYVQSISMGNQSRLVIRMPYGGRLTRIFVKDGFYLSAHPKIRVVYMDPNAEFVNGSWNGTYSGVENKDYSGNLLFYTEKDIAWPAINDIDSIQGTFISKGEISIQQHMTLAGQLLAEKITINADFNGTGFLYVPFDPPVLNIDPTALAMGTFPENDLDVAIPIKLSDTAKTFVYFNYCFDVKHESETQEGYASIEDFNVTSKANFPICGKDSGFVKIAAGETLPVIGSEVFINVKMDGVDEPSETLIFRVFNLSGAVMPDNRLQGIFKLTIANFDNVEPPFTKDVVVSVFEDQVLSFSRSDFYYRDTSLMPQEQKGIIIASIPEKGTLTYKGKKLTVTGAGGIHIPLDSIGDLKFVAAENEYDESSYASFDFAVENVIGLKSHNAKATLVVKPVNDPPVAKNATFTIKENNDDGEILEGTFVVSDVDDQEFTYKFDETDPSFAAVSELFVLNERTGEISVKPGVVLDFESMKNEFQIKVAISDKSASTGNPADILTVVVTATIKILDENESPILTPQNFTVAEHLPKGTVVDTVLFDDLDKAPAFRQDVFTAVGGDTAFFAISKDGVITTKKEFDYETERRLYTIDVALTDVENPLLQVVKTMTIEVYNVNENPIILTEKMSIKENSSSGTVVDLLKAKDLDEGDSVLTFKLVYPSDLFNVSESGLVTVKEGAKIDYETTKSVALVVEVTDAHGGSSQKSITVSVIDIPPSTLDIVLAESADTTWKNPDTIYTNLKDIKLYCSINGGAESLCADTTLTEGKNVIIRTFEDPSLDGPGSDMVVVFVSTAAPVVSIVANPENQRASNIYTIVEGTDRSDTNIYVNKTKNDILVSVKDPSNRKDTSFVVKLDLDTLTLGSKIYSSLAVVSKEGVALNETPSKGMSRTPVNGDYVKISYAEKVAGVDVIIGYMTDKKGNILKQNVFDEKGKADSAEVISVSYEAIVEGRRVLVSYTADALTGSPLYKDGEGHLRSGSSVDKEREKLSVSLFEVTYDYKDVNGNTVVISYAVDDEGNLIKNKDGDIGYQVSYSYVNKYGNSAEQSVFIVLDQKGPQVEILSPIKGAVVRSNFVNVVWTVDGVEQDSLTLQGLEKGPNVIVRFFRDKAGNESSDTVFVVMKDGKNVDVAVEQPVTEIPKDKVDRFYSINPPAKDQTFAVSLRNPTSGKEVETLIGGGFKTRSGSGKEPYPSEEGHLGPTLIMDVKLPVVNGVGGLATMDDLLSSDGMIPLEGVDAANSQKVTVENYAHQYCDDGINLSKGLDRINLYKSKLMVKIWVYTSLGNYVDYFSFVQDLNDPDFADDAGLLQMFFEMKPDRDGFVKAENGKMLGTGAYLYKVEATLKSELRCTLPPVADPTGKKRGDVLKSSDDLLKPFGYKRPEKSVKN